MTAPPWEFFCADGVDGLLSYGDVDHTILDPPYAQEVEVGNAANRVRDNAFEFAAMTDDLRNRTARAIATCTRRWALVFCASEETHLWRFALEAAGMSFYREGIWVRLNTQPQQNGLGPAQGHEAIVIAHSRVLPQRWNGGGKPAVWYAPIVRKDRQHPTQKPCQLLRELISDFTDEGEIVADPFAGVASTGIAAVGLGRRFVGWELDADHHANGKARLELPLFDRPPEQVEIASVPPKGARARARMELDRKILRALEGIGATGASVTDLVELLDATQRQISLSLKRLQKNGGVIRTGRTSQTRWYSATTPPENHEPRRASKDPRSRSSAACSK